LTIQENIMKRTGPTNPVAQQLITELKIVARKEDAPVWARIALDLERPTRNRRAVNVYTIDKYAKDGETVIIPGKVLGTGDLTRKVTVAAFTFSKQAVDKINSAGGKALAIQELLKQNPKGDKLRILG